MGEIVNKTKLSKVVGRTTQAIDKWEKEGLPVEQKSGKGRPNKYDTEKVIDWLINNRAGNIDYNRERARLTKLQADRQEVELQIIEKELLKADEVASEWSKLLSDVKNRFLSLPSRATALLQGVETPNETKKILDNLTREILQDLANYNQGNDLKGRPGVKSAPAAEDKRVG
jgi:phage terminase Nu1 subunit (DNA packaging protein)